MSSTPLTDPYHAASDMPDASESIEIDGGGRGGDGGDPYQHAEQNCTKKKYRKCSLAVLTLFLLTGFSFLIYAIVVDRFDDHNDPSHPHDERTPYSLDSMFNSTLGLKVASLAWLGSENQPEALTFGSEGIQQDQFLSIINQSFYITTLPKYDQPILLIDVNKLNKFGTLYTPTQTMSDTNKVKSARPGSPNRRLLRGDSFDSHEDGLPDISTLHSSSSSPSSSSFGSGPSTPRTLRPVSNRGMARVAHSHIAQYEAMGRHTNVQATHVTEETTKKKDASSAVEESVFTYSSYVLSPDQRYMLFGTKCTQLYRHSSFCVYLIYDIIDDTMTPLGGDGTLLRLASWSPKSSLLAFVRDNNIYTYDLTTQLTVQVTQDGLWDHIINGVMDWVYEEEIFESTSALWWSPGGDTFVFLHFNETNVPTYGFDFYQTSYNQEFRYKYPKAGFVNSIVDIMSYNVTSRVLQTYPEIRSKLDYEYVMNVVWFDVENVLIRVSNRLQNEWSLFRLTMNANDGVGVDGTFQMLSTEKIDTYFEPHTCLTSLSPLPYYIDLVTINNDSLELLLFSILDGSRLKVLTGSEPSSSNGHSVLGVNAVTIDIVTKHVQVYYTREGLQTDGSVAVPMLWGLTIDSQMNVTQPWTLVSYSSNHERLTWQSGSFSPTGRYFLLQESSGIPMSTLFSINPSEHTTTSMVVLADNTDLVNMIQTQYGVPSYFYTQIPSTLPGLMISVQIIMPSGMEPDQCSGERPVLLYTYSGPGSQTVTTQYQFGYGSTGAFHTSLVSSYGYIVVLIDTVGTSGKGESYRKDHTYMRLGLQEREDILAVTRWIGSQCWSDSSRISYWGWSYGGFLTSFTAASGSRLFANLISVAPVTSWLLYDSVYTERYMRRPIDNPNGYINTSVIASASTEFDSPVWHLFGGTADDNVHFQNSALLVDALIDLDMPLSIFYFPNRAHSLTHWKSGTPPRYLYERLIKIFTGFGGPNGNGAITTSGRN